MVLSPPMMEYMIVYTYIYHTHHILYIRIYIYIYNIVYFYMHFGFFCMTLVLHSSTHYWALWVVGFGSIDDGFAPISKPSLVFPGVLPPAVAAASFAWLNPDFPGWYPGWKSSLDPRMTLTFLFASIRYLENDDDLLISSQFFLPTTVVVTFWPCEKHVFLFGEPRSTGEELERFWAPTLSRSSGWKGWER